MSERTDGTLGKRETAREAFSGHRAMEAGWPILSTDGAMCRLDMEADRLLCDDGRTLLWRPRAGKAQRDRRVKGWAATGQHVGSHMRQEGRGTTDAPQQMDNGMGAEVVCLLCRRIENGAL